MIRVCAIQPFLDYIRQVLNNGKEIEMILLAEKFDDCLDKDGKRRVLKNKKELARFRQKYSIGVANGISTEETLVKALKREYKIPLAEAELFLLAKKKYLHSLEKAEKTQVPGLHMNLREFCEAAHLSKMLGRSKNRSHASGERS